MIAEAHGTNYEALRSLRDARKFSDSVVVFEGDDGGQIYAAFPVALVLCDETQLEELLHDLDAIAWPGSYPDSTSVRFERYQAGAVISGGMGGGLASTAGWVHEEFVNLGLDDEIREVVQARRERISRPVTST